MFKILGRILVILLISGLIAGGVYLAVQHNPAAFGNADRRAGFESRLNNNFTQVSRGSTLSQLATGTSGRPARFRSRDGDFEGGLSVGRGLLGVIRNLVVFSLITLLVITIQKAFSRISRKQPVRAG
jgi:hypothetical protein